MTFVYLLFACLLTALSRRQFKRWINPITVFIYPWIVMIIFYEFKFIQYYDLTIKTHIVLIATFVLYSIGVLAGCEFGSSKAMVIKLSSGNKRAISESEYKRRMRIAILVTTVIGGISTVMAIISIIGRYGLNFYNKITSIYSDRLLGNFQADSISYIGSFLFIAVIITGMYFTRYGFHPVMIPLFILIVLRPFTGGARQALVQFIVMLAMPFVLAWKEMRARKRAIRKSRKKTRRTIILIAAAVILLGGLLVFVSNQRSAYVVNSSFHNYASPGFEKVIEKIPGVYQLYSYYVSPLGVLNEFLKSPDFNFGANSLFPFYNVLNKFGFGIPVQRYQKFYLIPISINVGTAVRELIEDYSVAAFLMIALCGFAVGSAYKKYALNKSVRSTFVLSFMFFLACMSWYMWFLRDANLIIALIFGCFICDRIDNCFISDEYSRMIPLQGSV